MDKKRESSLIFRLFLAPVLFAAHRLRPEALRERDRALPPESTWFLSEKQFGAVAYTDLFARTFQGVAKRIPYLKELGISYLHLMPFFRSPEKENDGGYAVSSYRETKPALGSMEDLRPWPPSWPPRASFWWRTSSSTTLPTSTSGR